MDEKQISGIDRRRYIRVDSNIVVRVEEISGYAGSNRAVTKNLSRGGILFEYAKAFPLSTVLGLEMRIPDINKRIDCYGKVVRVEEIVESSLFDIGISFISINKDDLNDLDSFIQIKVKTI